jgi:hypothetical protein
MAITEFNKTNVDLQKNFIRGAARLVIADMSTPFAIRLADVIRTTTAAQANEVQTVTITGTPTGGTFTLSFKGYTTPGIAYNASNTIVQTALQALSSIGTGGATVTGSGPYIVTFANQLGYQNTPMITPSGTNLTGGTTPTITVVETTPGVGIYDALPNYTDLGATKGGITIMRNNSEETFDVDQIQADIMSVPTAWEMSVATQVAQADIDMLQYLWEGGAITLDAGSGERTLPLGTPNSYRQKRLVVLFQRQSVDNGVTAGGIRAYAFRISQRSPVESTIVHNKTGEQVSIPFTWKILADQSVQDPYARFGSIVDQM